MLLTSSSQAGIFASRGTHITKSSGGDHRLGVLNVCGPNMAQGFVALLVVIQHTSNQNVNMRSPNSSTTSERTFCTSWPIGFDSP